MNLSHIYLVNRDQQEKEKAALMAEMQQLKLENVKLAEAAAASNSGTSSNGAGSNGHTGGDSHGHDVDSFLLFRELMDGFSKERDDWSRQVPPPPPPPFSSDTYMSTPYRPRLDPIITHPFISDASRQAAAGQCHERPLIPHPTGSPHPLPTPHTHTCTHTHTHTHALICSPTYENTYGFN